MRQSCPNCGHDNVLHHDQDEDHGAFRMCVDCQMDIHSWDTLTWLSFYDGQWVDDYTGKLVPFHKLLPDPVQSLVDTCVIFMAGDIDEFKVRVQRSFILNCAPDSQPLPKTALESLMEEWAVKLQDAHAAFDDLDRQLSTAIGMGNEQICNAFNLIGGIILTDSQIETALGALNFSIEDSSQEAARRRSKADLDRKCKESRGKKNPHYRRG